MKTRVIPRLLALAAVATLIGLGALGCSKKITGQFVPDQRPVVRLTFAPVDTSHEEFYIYKMNWIGYDPDGQVVKFQYVVDPPTRADQETLWISTTKNEETILFPASKPESLGTVQPRSQGFHVFVVRAVDNLGMPSAPVARAFFSYGVAPTVNILTPLPNKYLQPTVTPAVQITWTGKDFIDPSGFLSEKPVRYKFKLFKRTDDLPWGDWHANPDLLRQAYAPNFAGWDSTGPDSAFVQYTDLVPQSEYLFVVIAISRSGAYSPIFDFTTNMLDFFVGFAGALGPQITMYNSFFSYTYGSGSGGVNTDPSRAVQIQVPADQKITFNWFADPGTGSQMKGYRWVMDAVNLDDETARTSTTDWTHWSDWDPNATTATVGPFTGGGDAGEIHNFYIEAEDINGLVSLGWIQFRVIKPTFDQPLLIVNDTRFNLDQAVSGHPDSLRKPSGAWPSAAELDTFLFAVGGYRWKMTPSPQHLSPPGIFHGYAFDTLGTRLAQQNPTIPLSLLGRYSHVIWMTDAIAALNSNAPTDLLNPQTTLYYMSDRNRQNTLATWVSQGGHLWALGGGFGVATNVAWNNKSNDAQGQLTFSSTLPNANTADLRPGRFTYDIAHWRSEWRTFGGYTMKIARLDQPDPNPYSAYQDTSAIKARMLWKGEPFLNAQAGVDYGVLPTQILPKTAATDPASVDAPARVNETNNFYNLTINLEYLRLENYITESRPVPNNPDATYDVSTLDTLYLAYRPNIPEAYLNQPDTGVNPVVTYYHNGSDNQDMVFSGIDIWSFRRQDCTGLVDFVLHQLWKMDRTALAARALATGQNRASVRPVAQKPVTPGTVLWPGRGAPTSPGRGTPGAAPVRGLLRPVQKH